MIDLSGWGFLVAVIVGWASVLFLILVFLAAAAGVRRTEDLRVARVVSDERRASDFQQAEHGHEHDTAFDEWYRPPGSHRG